MDARLIGLLHPKLFSIDQRAVVVARIRALPIHAWEKRSLLAAWLLRVDAPFVLADLDAVALVETRDAAALA